MRRHRFTTVTPSFGDPKQSKMHPDAPSFIPWFRNAAPYINAFRGRTFVISFSGETIEGKGFPHLLHDIALLDSLGVRLVLVFGARTRIERILAERGIESRYHQGLRITDHSALEAIKTAVGSLQLELEALLSMGLPNSPMAGASIRIVSGNFVTARPLGIREGIDLRHTGEVRRIDSGAISAQLDAGNIVLLPPLGYSPTGEIFNLRAERVASAAARALAAEKLIYLLEEEGLRTPEGTPVRELTVGEAEERLKKEEQSIPVTIAAPLACAIEACRGGVRRSHLLDSRIDGALLQELFTRDGCGTLVATERFEGIRAATIDDVGGILELITHLEQAGILVPRDREWLEMEIDHFCVAERDNAIIGCIALHPFPDEKVAEVAALAVHPDYRGEGRGERLLEFVEQRARQHGIERLFVLTTHTPHWFQERGYRIAAVEELPVTRQAMYNYQRNSRVYLKVL